MTVEAIKEAISQLGDDERHSLAAWLNQLDYDDWDRTMTSDFSAGGRGMGLVESVQREIAERKAVPFEEGLRRARRNRPGA